MRKVKSEKAPAETTRTVSRAAKAGPPAAVAKAARGSVSGPKRGSKGPAPAPVRQRVVEAKSGKRSTVRAAVRKTAAKPATKTRPSSGGKKRPAKAPIPEGVPVLQIRQLDPIRVCGDRTSVLQLFRVDEQAMAVGKAAGARQVHLVFNDRHGWYCEHGRSCHAVSAVMRHAGIR